MQQDIYGGYVSYNNMAYRFDSAEDFDLLKAIDQIETYLEINPTCHHVGGKQKIICWNNYKKYF